LPWLAGLCDRIVARRPATRRIVIPGAGHLVHVDASAEFVAAVREVAGSARV
jgi:pimeloyl-ACP methyl ester carboxylesterase